MSNKIQIKRSVANSTVTGLSNGELAFTANGNVLYIGSPVDGSSIRVGGEMTPGTLTANQALVANSTGGIDAIIAANADLGSLKVRSTEIYGGSYDRNRINLNLTADLIGGNYGVRVVTSNSGLESFVWNFDPDNGSLFTPGSIVPKTNSSFTVGTEANVWSAGYFGALAANSTAVSVGANLVINAAAKIIANGAAGASQILAANSTGGAYWLDQGSITINLDSTYSWTNVHTFSANLNANVVNASSFTIGTNFTANGTLVNAAAINVVNQVNTATIYATTSANVGANVYANTSAVVVGNSTVYTNVSAGVISLDGTTINGTSYGGSANNASYLGTVAAASYVQNTDSRTLSGNLTFTGANLSVTGSNTYITSNVNVSATKVTIASNVEITGANVYVTGNTTFNGSIGSNLIPTTNGTYSLGNSGMRWDKLWLTGSTIELGNVSISANGEAFAVNNLIVYANAQINNIIGSTTTFNSNVIMSGTNANISSNVTITGANINATSALLRVADAVISGNLTINGTLTTVNTNNLVVRDNLIQIASNNVSSDTLDSGFYVTANTDGVTRYSGLARFYGESTATNPVFKLFTTSTEPTTTVGTVNLGTLKAYLDTGAFVSNVGSVAITANSTVNVNIVANTLSLTTALAASGGGTGQNTYSVGDLLVGNSTAGLSKLSLSSTAGHVLQSNGTALVYDILDGGTF